MGEKQNQIIPQCWPRADRKSHERARGLGWTGQDPTRIQCAGIQPGVAGAIGECAQGILLWLGD